MKVLYIAYIALGAARTVLQADQHFGGIIIIRTVCLNPALDKTVSVAHMSLDAVNRISDMRIDAGGKGINVSKVVKKLGGQTKVYALLAGQAGAALAQMLQDMAIGLSYVTTAGETRTNLKIVDALCHTTTDLNEPGPVVGQSELDELLRALLGEVEPGDIVVLAGSLPVGAPKDSYASWARACKAAGAQVFLDAEGDALTAGISAKPSLIKPNNHELEGLVGQRLSTLNQMETAARELVGCGLDEVVVSLGAEGALFVLPDASYHANSPKVELGSTVGAGDSMVAALAYAKSAELSLEDSIRLSVAVGAANASMPGTQAAPRTLVDALFGQVNIRVL